MRILTALVPVLVAIVPLAACGDDGEADVVAGDDPALSAPALPDGDDGSVDGSDAVSDAGPVPDGPPYIVGTVTSVTVTEPVTEDCVDPATLDPVGSVSSDDPPVCTDPATLPIGTILVEELPDTAGGDKASLTVVGGIPFQRVGADGADTPAAFADLAEGVTVEVWVDGPVAESFPVQAAADAIRITG